jgi:hypothetical protein
MVTHLTTNPPVRCLYMAERTGSLVFIVLWSYVEDIAVWMQYKVKVFKTRTDNMSAMRM